MSTQQLLISEITQQPDPLLREVLHYLKFLKAQSSAQPGPALPSKRQGFGAVPGIVLADDFEAPLQEFAEYCP